MSSNIVSYCGSCFTRTDLCTCKNPNPICGTCDKPMENCKCDPDTLNHLCEFCGKWEYCDQVGKNGQWCCRHCQNNPAIMYVLRMQGTI